MDDAQHVDLQALGNAGTPEERRTGIGGSDAAAAIGLSPWMSPFDLWEVKTGLQPGPEQNEPMLWGKLLEDIIRREYARRTGMEVEYIPDLIRHPDHPFMFCHLDGRVGRQGRAILEVKCARTALGWGEPETDEIPLPYLTQCHHNMAVTAAEVCDVAVLIGGNDFRLYQVSRDIEIEQRLIDGEADFWRHVISQEPPPPITLQDAVKRWGHFDAQGFTMAGEQERAAIAVVRKAHALKEQIKIEEEAAKSFLIEAMGENGASLVDPNTGELLATYKLDHGRKAYSVAAKEPSRRLLVKNLEHADV